MEDSLNLKDRNLRFLKMYYAKNVVDRLSRSISSHCGVFHFYFYSEDFVILGVAVLIQCQRLTDGRTDGQTPRPWLRRAMHSAIARKTREVTLQDKSKDVAR